MIPSSHHGSWKGPNRLWFEDPSKPERSDGSLEVSAAKVAYTWSFKDSPEKGEIELFGPAGSVRAGWTDSWHAKKCMTLHGCFAEGCLVLYGTYGEEQEWGWRIELDTRDPEHFVMRMFNLMPDGDIAPAVDLRGARA